MENFRIIHQVRCFSVTVLEMEHFQLEPLVTVIKHPTQAWCLEEERDELLRKTAVCL